MFLLWVLAAASTVLAVLAWRKARAAARRAEQLSQMYWELKYQHGELRAWLQRQTSSGDDGNETAGSSRAGGAGGAPQADGFIPLSSLKR
jgi:hypothetical protein